MNPTAVAVQTPTLRWKTIQRRSAGHFRVFEAEWVERQHPITQEHAEFLVLHTPVWVNVIPITHDGRVVMVRQYRHGIDAVTLEFPGGIVSSGEDPAAAAMRECVEETGYRGDPADLALIGMQHPNPAFMSTQCLSYVWHKCQPIGVPQGDAHEVIEVVTYPLDAIDNLIARGQIQHSIILAAWTLYRLHALPVEQYRGGSDG